MWFSLPSLLPKIFLRFSGGCLCCFSLRLYLLFVVSCLTMSSSFAKIHRKNGSFYAGDIRLDPFETIRVVGEAEGVRDGLEFTVLGKEARITDHWRGDGEAQTGHFHVISLQNGLRFPLPGFVLELLHDYGVAPSQLAPNAWRIIAAFYIGCHIIGVAPTSRLFRSFFF